MARLKVNFGLFEFAIVAVAVSLLFGNVASADEGVPLHGFADVGWGSGASNQPPRERTRGFVLGTVDIYLTPQFQDNVKSLIEIALEPGLDSEDYELDVERIQVGYTFSEAANIWVGRFHTPYGYWNTAYHHGAEIQPSIYKPRFLDWEDHAGFMPSHSTGLWFNGKIPLGRGKVQYDLFYANGNRNLQGNEDMNILRDDNSSPSYGGRITYHFAGALDGLLLGVHGLRDEVDAYNATPGNSASFVQKADLTMYGAFAVYEIDRFEFSSELYAFVDQIPNISNSGTYHSMAYFAHLGYTPITDTNFYIRYENANIDQEDPYFNTLTNGFSYVRGVAGVRYAINPRTCVKLEFNRTSIKDSLDNTASVQGSSKIVPTTYNEVRAQYAISF